MKHTAKVLLAFVSLFLLSQVLGLYLLSISVSNIVETDTGSIQVIYTNTSIGERPEVEGYSSLLYIAIGVLIGTILLLLIAKFNKVKFWKVWFFLAAWMTMSISLGVILGERLFVFGGIIAALLALAKINYPNPILHNLTEILMYAGIGLFLAPILSVPVAILLLIAVSIYDAYAVWKSKHMVKLAEFTKKSNLFPGLALAYTEDNHKTRILSSTPKMHNSKSGAPEFVLEDKNKPKKKKSETRIGVLGGGDVIFPLLFAGAVFTQLISRGITSQVALAVSLIISIGAAGAITLLFIYGKKDRYYPAMPFITAGCFAGYLITLLIV
jgi:presenilin-like A22 family membrane protease